MAEKIKNFFAKKKADAKFKLAGPGHKLTDNTSNIVGPSKNNKKKPAPRTDPSEATRQAAQAALARVSQVKDSAFNTSLAAIQAQVRRELENEKGSVIQENFIPQKKPEETELEASPHLAVKGMC